MSPESLDDIERQIIEIEGVRGQPRQPGGRTTKHHVSAEEGYAEEIKGEGVENDEDIFNAIVASLMDYTKDE